jgi:hypothetical protein
MTTTKDSSHGIRLYQNILHFPHIVIQNHMFYDKDLLLISARYQGGSYQSRLYILDYLCSIFHFFLHY